MIADYKDAAVHSGSLSPPLPGAAERLALRAGRVRECQATPPRQRTRQRRYRGYASAPTHVLTQQGDIRRRFPRHALYHLTQISRVNALTYLLYKVTMLCL